MTLWDKNYSFSPFTAEKMNLHMLNNLSKGLLLESDKSKSKHRAWTQPNLCALHTGYDQKLPRKCDILTQAFLVFILRYMFRNTNVRNYQILILLHISHSFLHSYQKTVMSKRDISTLSSCRLKSQLHHFLSCENLKIAWLL